MLQQAEQAIVDRVLSIPDWPNIRVAAWPDSPLEFGRSQMQAGVYIRFAGLNLPRVEGHRQDYVQQGTADFEIRLLVKDLRSHTGAYELAESIHRRLTGFRLATDNGYAFGLPGLFMTKFSLVDRYKESNQWDWGAIFSTQVTYEGHYDDRNWPG
jgi:Gp37 protein